MCRGRESLYNVKNILNFGYGVKFKYNGLLHHNLDRVWVGFPFNLWRMEIFLFLYLFIVVIVSTEAAKCSDSGLQIVKTKLQSTMGQQRLNALMLLYIHKENTYKLSK